jgi:hypothetical protein
MKQFLKITVFLITILGYSQFSEIKFGIQAGLNYSDFRGYDAPTSDSYYESPGFSFLGGVNIESQFHEKLSLKIELNFERKTQKADNFISLTDLNGVISYYNFNSYKNFDYLVLPIMLKYNLSDENSFYINGGPFIGFLLKSYFTNDIDVEGLNNEVLDTTDLNKTTDFGFALGFGKTINFNDENSIFLELRANVGLTNTSKISLWENNGESKTGSLNFILGYSFSLN